MFNRSPNFTSKLKEAQMQNFPASPTNMGSLMVHVIDKLLFEKFPFSKKLLRNDSQKKKR